MRSSTIPFLALLLATLAAAPVQGQQAPNADNQQSGVTDHLNTLVASHESVSDRQRNEVTTFLLRSDVQEIAKNRGIEMSRVQAAAGTMSNTQIGEVAALVATLPPAQEGRGLGSVTISVAAVIIILLILILVT
jgi:hypothetical protein